jgi:hypothetical protein
MSKRFADLEPRESWGYAVWGAGALVVVIPEVTAAAFKRVPWPTISATVGHLEYRWSWVALIVVAIITAVALQAARFPVSESGQLTVQADQRRLGRTGQGRFTRSPATDAGDQQKQTPVAWLAFGAGIVAVGSGLTGIISPGNKFILAYVLYGLIATVFVIIPSVLAFWFAKDVPFPTFFRTIAYLERRLHFAALLIVVGLVILLIHLALYPWPSIFHQLHPPRPISP